MSTTLHALPVGYLGAQDARYGARMGYVYRIYASALAIAAICAGVMLAI